MIDNEKNILNDKELEGVSGGKTSSRRVKATNSDVTSSSDKLHCSFCNADTVHIVYTGGRAVCSKCSTVYTG